uniref:Transmembrane protein n=1 Tax=Panagrolaimus superbus TaxID=310955 RepID=A0A914Z8J3_9BILA
MDDQYYDPTNPKYKCCCGCHVTIATRIICWINIIIVAVIVLCTIYFNDEGPYDEPEINGSSVVLLIIAALVPVITAVTPLYGLKVENHKWLIPFLVVN